MKFHQALLLVDDGWTVKELATKAEIVTTMQYAAQNIHSSNAREPGCLLPRAVS